MDKKLFFNYRCSLINVVDGDTLDLQLDLGFHLYQVKRIRMLGYNSPEIFGGHSKTVMEKELGKEIMQELINAVFNKQLTVTTELDRTDKYGRILGRVYANDVEINSIMKVLCDSAWARLRKAYPEIVAYSEAYINARS